MATHNDLQLQFQSAWRPLLASLGTRYAHGTQAYMQANTQIRNKTTPNDRLQKARETQRHGACLPQDREDGRESPGQSAESQDGKRGCQHQYWVAVGGRPAPVCRETLRHRRAAREVPCALPCPLHRGGRDTAAFQAWSCCSRPHQVS